MKKLILFPFLFLILLKSEAQIKILFDATKAESAGNADWVIDADQHNIGYNTAASIGGGNEANAQQTPTPNQMGITINTSQNYWDGALSAWAIDNVKQGYTVESLPYNGSITYGTPSNPQDLSNYKVFVVCEPNILFTTNEKIAMMNFIQNGGGLFMISDHDNSDRNFDGADSPHIWNDFIQNNSVQNNPFGFLFDYDFFDESTTNIANLPEDSLLHGSYGNVSQLQFFGATSMTLIPSQNSTIKGIVYKTGFSNTGNTGVLCAYAKYGKGKIVAFGDSSPIDDGTGDFNDNLFDGWISDANGNHQRLIMNATIWLVGGGNTPTNIEIITSKQTDFKVYAFDKKINIENNAIKPIQLNIFAINGQKIGKLKRIAPHQQLTINIAQSGVYFYQLIQENKIIGKGKIALF